MPDLWMGTDWLDPELPDVVAKEDDSDGLDDLIAEVLGPEWL